MTSKKFQSVPKEIFQKRIPILGICYGLQFIAKLFGGKIKSSKKEENLVELFSKKKSSSLLINKFLNTRKVVWMSHEDAVVKFPKNFKIIASTKELKINNY